MAFHPELRRVARVLPRTILTPRSLPVLRQLSRLAARRTPRGVSVTALGRQVGLRIHQPAEPVGDGAAVLWIHGGGYVMGSAAQNDKMCARLARHLGRPVFAVEYRLAPEHPYPAALEDCYRALLFVARQPGVDPTRIAIAGASAGGGLAAALAITARDRGEVAPLFQLLVYPMTDAPPAGGPAEVPSFRIWNHASNRLGWELYLSGADPEEVAPLRRHDLSRLPPAWIGVGTLDPLHDEGIAYAAALRDAGVPCGLHVVDGAFHGFDMVVPGAAVSRDFFARQVEALRQTFEGAD